MNVLIKQGATLKFISEIVLEAFRAVSDECEINGVTAMLTSGSDGTHPKKHYHGQGYGWDFRVKDWPLLSTMYQNIRARLKTLDTGYRLELELLAGNEHLHIHYAYDEVIQSNTIPVGEIQPKFF